MTPAVAQRVLDELAVLDARDSLRRAVAWVVLVRHVETEPLTVYGTFTEPASALAWASDFEAGLNVEGEDGFRCEVHPVMPAGD